MCDKAVNTHTSKIQCVPDCYKTQEMCENVVSEDPFMLVYCSNKYKNQRICDEAFDDSLASCIES